ncbi:hypothetical protein [Vibrio phage V-YDF132]|nr:hypothetical protein [Vibrio phage V-YDF132]
MHTLEMGEAIHHILSAFGAPTEIIKGVTAYRRVDKQDGAVVFVDGSIRPLVRPDLYDESVIRNAVTQLFYEDYTRVTVFMHRNNRIHVIKTTTGNGDPESHIIDLQEATVASLDMRLAQYVGYGAIPVWVYRTGDTDCTNGGLSSQHDTLYLVDQSNPFAGWSFKFPDDERLLSLRVVRGTHGYPDSMNAHPMSKNQNGQFGGNFVWSVDSRFRTMISNAPIKVHDRYEY